MFTQQRIGLMLMGGMAAVGFGLAGIFLATGYNQTATLSSAATGLIFGVLLWFYWRGRTGARYIAVATVALITAATLPNDQQQLAVLVPAVIALALTDALITAGVGLAVLAMLLVRGGGESTYADIGTFTSYIVVLGIIVLTRLALDNSRQAAEESAGRAKQAQLLAEERAAEIEQQRQHMIEQNQRQAVLADLVQTLEAPAVRLANGVLLAPIVGNVDTRRADRLSTQLLEQVHRSNTSLVIIDIAGVPLIDTAVARALTDLVAALRLLGCQVVLTGISATVASTLIDLGTNFDELATAASPQEALARTQYTKLGM